MSFKRAEESETFGEVIVGNEDLFILGGAVGSKERLEVAANILRIKYGKGARTSELALYE